MAEHRRRHWGTLAPFGVLMALAAHPFLIGCGAAALPANEPRSALERVWNLKEVRYTDGRAAFVPKRHGGVTFYRDEVIWSDGCNQVGGRYAIAGEKLRITGLHRTGVWCNFRHEDVHYEQATRFEIQGRQLTLYTPRQVYVLEQFPYSPMSENEWSLYSITDRKSGETRDVDHWRGEYDDLLFVVERDRVFRFVDLDKDELTGTVRVTRGGHVRFRFDPASEQKLSRKLPTTYVHQVRWAQIKDFRVFHTEVIIAGRSEQSRVLELYTDREVYRFILRSRLPP